MTERVTLSNRRRDVLKVVDTYANEFQEGDVVDTPDGIGVVVGVFTSSFDVDGETIEASSDSPTYAVALVDSKESNFYKASELSPGELPEHNVENPVEDAKGMADTMSATMQVDTYDWTMPDTWQKAEKPARLILLDAWASMGGQFNCGGGCCMGELKSRELCAAMKDEVVQGNWRDWGD